MVALVSFWFRAAMFAPMHKRVGICIIISALLEAANPRVIALNICSAFIAVKPNRLFVENSKKKQTS
jgi:hypothetical protein